MTKLRCLDCGRGYDVNEPVWACACHGALDLHMEARFPVKAIRLRRPGLWRYREALPIERDENIVSFGEGFTPLFPVDHEGHRLFLKLDFLFPTGSFKDRGASVLLSKVKELGIHRVVEDSSGNAGAAIAAYSALAGVQCQVFVPSSTSRTKIRQIELSGAQLVRINGSRADTARAAFEAAQHSYYASHYWNPYFFEGTKTVAFEVWEQLGEQVPDNVVVPVGHGTMLLGMYKGFEYLARAGVTDRLPRVFAVQTAACAPLYQMFHQHLDTVPAIKPEPTVAEGIAISTPLRWKSILQAVAETGGTFVTVSERAIKDSMARWARRGILMEPTAATATAGFERLAAQAIIGAAETTVVPVTGAGLKTAAYI